MELAQVQEILASLEREGKLIDSLTKGLEDGVESHDPTLDEVLSAVRRFAAMIEKSVEEETA